MEKDRFDSFMKLADFLRNTRENRQKTEWKLSFTLWGALAGAAFAFKKADLPLLVLIVSGAIVAVAHFWWVEWNCRRADSEGNAMYHFAHLAEKELSVETPHFKEKSETTKFHFLWHTPALLQWLITVGLVIGAIIVIQAKV